MRGTGADSPGHHVSAGCHFRAPYLVVFISASPRLAENRRMAIMMLEDALIDVGLTSPPDQLTRRGAVPHPAWEDTAFHA